MEIELSVSDPAWDVLEIENLMKRACGAVLDHFGISGDTVEISMLATDDAEIATLNAEFRGRPTATNVLSWPAQDLAAEVAGGQPEQPERGFDGMIALGDIALAYGTCAAEAAAGNMPLHDHVTHLIVHGALHLLGYDHTRDGDAALMEGLEIEILGKLGLDDPYRDKDAADPQ